MTNANRETGGAISQVEQQHQGIRESIASIHQALSDGQTTLLAVAAQLCQFCVTLEEHFETEEQAGFFDQIVDQAPRLSGRTQKLSDEHGEFISSLKTLVKTAVDSDNSANSVRALSDAFHQLSKQLMLHESEENELLQQAYSEDIGSKD